MQVQIPLFQMKETNEWASRIGPSFSADFRCFLSQFPLESPARRTMESDQAGMEYRLIRMGYGRVR